MSRLRCPTCDKLFDVEQTKAMPFCSDNCRRVDLGRWLKEEHRLPHVPDPDELEESLSDNEPQ
ncbi:MAG: DNA gyrase inhibitor YacG [Planctomycetaceae bacterium]|nr:DNA gyrase inhibitor YacG [Planctomycetales bacterium]MCB9926674.1 DNA gyrase inhibitor YacG [Planctomycetaceae bacterium]